MHPLTKFSRDDFDVNSYVSEISKTLDEFIIRKKYNQLKTLSSKLDKHIQVFATEENETIIELEKSLKSRKKNRNKRNIFNETIKLKEYKSKKKFNNIDKTINEAIFTKKEKNKSKFILLSRSKQDILVKIESKLVKNEITLACTQILSSFSEMDFKHNKVSTLSFQICQRLLEMLQKKSSVSDIYRHPLVLVSQFTSSIVLEANTSYLSIISDFSENHSLELSKMLNSFPDFNKNNIAFHTETYSSELYDIISLFSLFLKNIKTIQPKNMAFFSIKVLKFFKISIKNYIDKVGSFWEDSRDYVLKLWDGFDCSDLISIEKVFSF